jgi:site-specific DNA-methyltransferase (adenine-specific)
MNKLILGDCFEAMDALIKDSVTVDFILTDLPYGITQNELDKPLPLRELWRRYHSIIKPNGCIALFAQGLFFVDLVNSNRNHYRYDLIWDKVLSSGFLNAKRMPLRTHEQIAIFYGKLPTYNPQFTSGKPLHGRGTAYLAKDNVNQNYGKFEPLEDVRHGCTQKYPTSILQFRKPHPAASLHPTEKSVECCEWLIKTYTNEGETVLDSCMGGGTTGVAAKACGRSFIGIEKDENYFKIAEDRLKCK